MYRSKSNFNNVMQALTGAFLLALIVAGVLGITRVYAARTTSNSTVMASLGDSNSCAAGMQSSDFYLLQEQAILSLATQSNKNVPELASLSSANSCAPGTQSSDDYLRQEQAILRLVSQSNWSVAELESLSISISTGQANP
jgi:hypothetical protein